MTPSYTLIVGAAPAPGEEQAYQRIVNAAPRVIAADGGLGVCLNAGRMPDVVLGDFDSVEPPELQRAIEAGSQLVRHPAEKDDSDLDLALLYARSEGATAVRFTAAFSGRLDHTLAAIGTLMRSADLAGRIEEPRMDGYVLSTQARCSLTMHAPVGRLLSVFALGSPAVVSIDGVRFPLEVRSLPVLSSLGLSNITLEPEQMISVHEGVVIALLTS